MSAGSVKTRRAPPRHCKDARVYGHATTVRQCMIPGTSYTPAPFVKHPQRALGSLQGARSFFGSRFFQNGERFPNTYRTKEALLGSTGSRERESLPKNSKCSTLLYIAPSLVVVEIASARQKKTISESSAPCETELNSLFYGRVVSVHACSLTSSVNRAAP